MRVNGGWRKLVLAAGENEKPQHLGLKLAAYLLYWDEELTVEASSKHPALFGQAFRPDLLGTDITGSVGLWVECGKVTRHKLGKLLRRWPEARLTVVKENRAQAERLREMLDEEIPRSERVEVLCWPGTGFNEWMGRLSEKTEIIGEAGGVSFNLVVNEQVYVADLLRL